MLTVLICDDDKEIAKAIQIYLSGEGYNTVVAHNGKEALEEIDTNEIHLIIMDVMMPIMDGHTATIKIRNELNIPIIMLSAKSEDLDKIHGLNLGADDYLTKPFNPLELIARVKSQMRRYTKLGSMATAHKDEVLVNGGIVLNDNNKTVSVDGEDIRLTPIEYKIMLLLMSNLDRVFSIDQIYSNVWGEDPYLAENTVAVHIRRIREKIEINPKEPQYLKVVWGIGYKIEKIASQ